MANVIHSYCPCGNHRKKSAELCKKCARQKKLGLKVKKNKEVRKAESRWQTDLDNLVREKESLSGPIKSTVIAERPCEPPRKRTVEYAEMPCQRSYLACPPDYPDENEQDTVDIEVSKVLAITEKAILVVVDGKEEWVPRSQIVGVHDSDMRRLDKITVGDEDIEIEATEWIAEKCGWM